MTSTILRSSVAAIALAGALAHSPRRRMAEMMNFKAESERQERSAREYHRRHRLGDRHLRHRQQKTHLERQL